MILNWFTTNKLKKRIKSKFSEYVDTKKLLSICEKSLVYILIALGVWTPFILHKVFDANLNWDLHK